MCLYIFTKNKLNLCTGEDEVAFARHTKALQDEYKKQRPNPQVVEELMAASFALRRADVLQQSLDVKEIESKYPFLMDTAQVRLYIMLYFTQNCLYKYAYGNSGKFVVVKRCVTPPHGRV